jgi:2,3,4,5-tetrahydropyridine-2-carboxylate N-succinyltransferase
VLGSVPELASVPELDPVPEFVEGPRTVKAVELSGVPGLLFRRNSLTGAVEVVARAGEGIHLNPELHP